MIAEYKNEVSFPADIQNLKWFPKGTGRAIKLLASCWMSMNVQCKNKTTKFSPTFKSKMGPKDQGKGPCKLLPAISICKVIKACNSLETRFEMIERNENPILVCFKKYSSAKHRLLQTLSCCYYFTLFASFSKSPPQFFLCFKKLQLKWKINNNKE